MYELCKKAASRKDITAWVCANDAMAFPALAYCRNKNVKVPQRISVVGFDDSPQAITSGLTSYNFNGNGLVNSVLAFILNRPEASLFRNQKVINLKGFIAPRATTKNMQPGE
jgi:DNA-binding LacI/PurR family transcriptional regulator